MQQLILFSQSCYLLRLSFKPDRDQVLVQLLCRVRSAPAPCLNQRRWDGQTYEARSLVNAQSNHASHSHGTHDVLPEQESVEAD